MRQPVLFEVAPVENSTDRKERLRRVTALLRGVKPRQKRRWKCLNCNYAWWDSKTTGPAGVCPECDSVKTAGALR